MLYFDNAHNTTLSNLKKFNKYLIFLGVSTTALVFSGCATKPIYQTNTVQPAVMINAKGVPNYYLVKRGDTVSQIAARYGLNFRQIGALNGLDSQYTIYTGQWLKLWNQQAYQRVNPKQTSPSLFQRINKNQPTYINAAQQNDLRPTANVNTAFKYPTSNQVIKNFNVNNEVIGMWFAGRMGDPVYASNAGSVLYSGNGLPEYGNLIMIRHQGNYITAYAHNQKLLVKEGDSVQQGQTIATMGNSGQTEQVALEFQVRLNGTPIDPRAVLSK